MGSIAIRKHEPSRPETAPAPATWEPGRMLRNVLTWDPFQIMAPFPAFGAIDRTSFEFAPAFEVKETPAEYVFRADVPGVAEKDLEVTFTGNRLTVSGRREAEHKERSDTFYAYERTFGSFTRSFTLPEGADAANARADLKDGVLSLAVPKKPEVMPKKIEIKGAGKPA